MEGGRGRKRDEGRERKKVSHRKLSTKVSYEKNTSWAEDIAQKHKCVPGKCKVLNLIPLSKKHAKKKKIKRRQKKYVVQSPSNLFSPSAIQNPLFQPQILPKVLGVS